MKNEKKKSKVFLYAIIAVIIIAVVGIGAYFIKNSKNIKNETITAENYEEIMDRIGKELKDENDKYYLSYSVMYYVMKDGIASVFSENENTSTSSMYTNIYGKTIKQLIDEGKQLMKENNITLDEYKSQLQNTINNQ